MYLRYGANWQSKKMYSEEDTLSKEQVEELKNKHEAIRTVLMDNNCEEYGDCIIDEICEAVGILPTTIYYIEGE